MKLATPQVPSLSDILVGYRKRIVANDMTLYLRALSAPQLTDQENYALIASHTERKALRDRSTIIYQAYIDPISDLDNEDLDIRVSFSYMQAAYVETWIELPDISRTPLPIMEESSSDPLEQRELDLVQPLTAQEQRQINFEKQRSELHQGKMDTKKEWLSAASREDKIKEATRLTIQERANSTYNKASRYALAVLCSYSDELCAKHLWALGDYIPDSLVNTIATEYVEVGSTNLLPFSERL